MVQSYVMLKLIKHDLAVKVWFYSREKDKKNPQKPIKMKNFKNSD